MSKHLEDLVLLSQRELLAQETLCDLLSEKAHHQSSSWSSYVPPSRFTEQVLATLEDTQNGKYISNNKTFLNFDTRALQSEEEDDEETDRSNSEIDDDSAQQGLDENPNDKGYKNQYYSQRPISPSPPSSPLSSSSALANFAQQITSLNLSSQPTSHMQPSNQYHDIPPLSLPHTSNMIPILPLPLNSSSEKTLPSPLELPFQTRNEQSSVPHARPFFFHPALNSDRQALPLRRSMSSETNRQSSAPSLPRKRPSSDSILASNPKGAHTSSSVHISSTSLNSANPPTLLNNISQKNRQKKKRRRRDEIERKFTCCVGDCAKSYGSEGALKTHVKLKHPEMYVEQFSWSKGNESGSPPSPGSSISQSPPPESHLSNPSLRAALAL